LGGGVGLLVDTGSPGNLQGSEFRQMAEAEAIAAGRGPVVYTPLQTNLGVGGVGKGTQTATHKATIPIGIDGEIDGRFSAPELPSSGCPGLLGRRSLKDHRTLIDCYNNRMYCIGPGGYKIHLSPGSRIHGLSESPAGHMMLPCSRFPATRTPPVPSASFNVEQQDSTEATQSRETPPSRI